MSLFCEKFMVIRIDDNGSAFLVAEDLTDMQADKMVDEFFGHKQFYMKLGYTSSTRPQVLAEHKILQ